MVRIGYQATIHHLALMAADDKGLLPAGTILSEFPSGVPEIQAMKDKKLDAIYVCDAPLNDAIKKGLDAKIVVGVNNNGSSLVFKGTYIDAKSLNGKKIGVVPGSFQEMLLKTFIAKEGLNTQIVDVKDFPKQADGAFLPEQLPKKFEKDGHGKVVITSKKMMGDHACCGLAVSGNLIKSQPALVNQLVKAHKDATAYIQGHITDGEDARIAFKYIKGNKDVIEAALNTWEPSWWISDPKP